MSDNVNLDVFQVPPEEFGRYQLLDIRETIERLIDPLKERQSLHYPLSRFQREPYSFQPECRYLIFCAHGVRSRNLVEILRRQGHNNVYAIANGLDAIKTYCQKHGPHIS